MEINLGECASSVSFEFYFIIKVVLEGSLSIHLYSTLKALGDFCAVDGLPEAGIPVVPGLFM